MIANGWHTIRFVNFVQVFRVKTAFQSPDTLQLIWVTNNIHPKPKLDALDKQIM